MDIVTHGRSHAAFRVCATVAAIAALALCAHAGGRSKSGKAEPRQEPGIAITKIKASASSGKASSRGPSANIGQRIRLNGTGFDDNVSIQFTAFANSTFLIRPLEVNGKKLDVAVPAEVITGSVVLVDPDTGRSNEQTLQIVPTITTLSSERVAPGERLLIDGAGFTRDTTVTFQGVERPVAPTIVSPSRIDIIVPPSAKSGKITVVTPGGRSKAVKLTVTREN